MQRGGDAAAVEPAVGLGQGFVFFQFHHRDEALDGGSADLVEAGGEFLDLEAAAVLFGSDDGEPGGSRRLLVAEFGERRGAGLDQLVGSCAGCGGAEQRRLGQVGELGGELFAEEVDFFEIGFVDGDDLGPGG